MIPEHINIILKRDSSPKRGQESLFQYILQCKLRIWSSKLILLIFCTTSIVLLGIQAGVEKHLRNLENDPFSSAIHIQGRFNRTDLHKLKNDLWFNSNTKIFDTKQSLDSKSVIKAFYPYNSMYLRFIKRDGNTMTKNVYKVQSVNISKKQNPNDADIFINKWVQESLIFGDEYFSQMNGRNVNEYQILSKELYQSLGYPISQNSVKPESIEILNFFGPNILETRGKKGDNIFSKLTDVEKIKYTIAIPLLNIAKHLPGCDMLIPESMFKILKNGYYKPCKAVYFSDIKLANNSKMNQDTINRLIKWIYQQDFARYIQEEPYVDPDKRFIKIRFIDMIFDKKYKRIVTRCNIKIKCLDLKKIIGQEVSTFFGNDTPEYNSNEEKIEHNYSDAFLYIKTSNDIIDNIQKLSLYLSSKYGLRIDTHQVMTLKKYRKELRQMNVILTLVLGCIGLLTFFYVLSSFSLFLQTKMQRIGMLKSYGFSQKEIYTIYLWEAIKLNIWALSFAFLIGLLIWYFRSYINIPFVLHYSFFIFFSISIIVTASLAALLATISISIFSPYKLISYKL